MKHQETIGNELTAVAPPMLHIEQVISRVRREINQAMFFDLPRRYSLSSSAEEVRLRTAEYYRGLAGRG